MWGQYFLERKAVGETDRAVWVFYQLAYGPHAEPEHREEFQKAFRDDAWIRKRHADNLLGPFFRQYAPLKQAEFLMGIDDNLAGKISGCEFEVCLKILVNDERDFKIWREESAGLTGRPRGSNRVYRRTKGLESPEARVGYGSASTE